MRLIVLIFILNIQVFSDTILPLKDIILSPEPHSECLKIGKNGRIYISDKKTYQINIYSEKGKLLYTMGGKGQGPGEFQRWSFPTSNRIIP